MSVEGFPCFSLLVCNKRLTDENFFRCYSVTFRADFYGRESLTAMAWALDK